MSFVMKGESVLASHELSELKLVYRVLHKNLASHPDLMDSHFLVELQSFLHRMAAEDGVDATHHSAWDAWLAEA